MSIPVVAVVTASSNSGAQAVSDLMVKYAGKAHVRAAYRSAEKAAPAVATFAGNPLFTAVTGIDAYQPETLGAAFAGAQYAIIVTPHDPANTKGFQDDSQLTCNLIAAAIAAGVAHIVFVGSWTVHCPDAIPTIAQRFVGPEAALTSAASTHWTLLRSGFFNQNFVGMLGKGIAAGKVTFPDFAIPTVDPADMGRVAAAIVASENPAVHAGQKYDISGPELLRVGDIVAAIAKATGQSIAYEPVPVSALLPYVPPYLAELLKHMHAAGDAAIPFSDVTRTICGEHTSLATWLETHAAAFKPSAGAAGAH